MNLTALPSMLLNYLTREDGWVPKGKLTAEMVWKHPRGKNYGKRYLPETVGRALRSLEAKRLIAVKPDGVSVVYKALPYNLRARYIPYSERWESKKEILFKA